MLVGTALLQVRSSCVVCPSARANDKEHDDIIGDNAIRPKPADPDPRVQRRLYARPLPDARPLAQSVQYRSTCTPGSDTRSATCEVRVDSEAAGPRKQTNVRSAGGGRHPGAGSRDRGWIACAWIAFCEPQRSRHDPAMRCVQYTRHPPRPSAYRYISPRTRSAAAPPRRTARVARVGPPCRT